MEAPVTVGLVLSGIIFIVGMIGGYIPLYRVEPRQIVVNGCL